MGYFPPWKGEIKGTSFTVKTNIKTLARIDRGGMKEKRYAEIVSERQLSIM